MKVPLSWLKEYLDLSIPPEKISEVLTLAGIEVEGIETYGSSFTGVVVAKVLSTKPHPNADRLCVASVFDGKEEIQIVCGAKNCRPGLTTALAQVGAELPPDESGKPFKIKKGKLRDVESFGMLCGADELGLKSDNDGIIELPEYLVPGTDLKAIVSDVIFDISLTPNLGHCLSIVGIARELSALLNIPIKKRSDVINESGISTSEMLSVEIESKVPCFKYMARVVSGVTVKASPNWLKQKLELCGLRSINSVVDVSNYVMLCLGQPLHMFDLDKIEKRKIIVSSETTYSSLKTLDGIDRKIPKDSLLIADANRPLAFAGIMGGEDSAVTNSSKNIAIEAAIFSPQAIRKGCKQLGIKTDSSQRFERGVDPLALAAAIDLAALLLQEISGGEIASKPIEVTPHPYIPKKLTCRIQRVHTLLGLDLSIREIIALLDRLEIRTIREHEHSIEVMVPSYRNDINEEIDLIEEIIRIYGYNKIPKRSPKHVSSTLTDAPMYLLENHVRDRLVSEGMQEFITCDLISPSLSVATIEPTQKHISTLSVLQSKSQDFSVLRSNLMSGLLQTVKHNIDHQNTSLSGFEIGRVHFKLDDQVEEIACAGILLTGKNSPHHYDPKPKDVDFFDLKGIIENLCEYFNVSNLSFEETHYHNFQPGRQARVQYQGITLGVVGQVHPNTLGKFGIEQKVYYAELTLNDLIEVQHRNMQVVALPNYPGSERDWTVTVKKSTTTALLLNTILEEKGVILEKVFLLDMFESEKLGVDRKNLTFRFCYRNNEKTLSYETVETEHANLIQKVAKKLVDCLL
ncbi:MAG: phenylalanine--tRNA ligase subunit beta [Chlamydiae bacterium]|nr:phenylalanine--tRNA ligase subunit beta [Chlamydiota bacterium]